MLSCKICGHGTLSHIVYGLECSVCHHQSISFDKLAPLKFRGVCHTLIGHDGKRGVTTWESVVVPEVHEPFLTPSMDYSIEYYLDDMWYRLLKPIPLYRVVLKVTDLLGEVANLKVLKYTEELETQPISLPIYNINHTYQVTIEQLYWPDNNNPTFYWK